MTFTLTIVTIATIAPFTTIPTFTLANHLATTTLNPTVVTIKIYVISPTTQLTLSSHVTLTRNTSPATT